MKMKGRYSLPEGDYREEKLSLTFGLRPNLLTDEQKEETHKQFKWRFEDDGPELDYIFDFHLEYFDLVNQLELIIRLYDEGVIYRVVTEELKHHKCIIQELLGKLELLEQKFKEQS